MARQHLDPHPGARPGAPAPRLGPLPSEPVEDGPRLSRFLGIERAGAPSRATLALQARRPAAPAEGRLAPFLRVARGREA